MPRFQWYGAPVAGVMNKSIAVIVATTGRRSLQATLDSFGSDLHPQDVVHICMDGRSDLVRRIAQEMAEMYFGHWFYHEGETLGYWGHAVRNQLLPSLGTDLVWHLDDDDVAAPGALAAIRHSDAVWTVFRMQFMEGHPANGVVCWRWKRLMKGDIGTPMIIAPPSTARFALEYGGDFAYVQGLRDELGEPAWDERVIALIRPEVEDVVQVESNFCSN
jgi:hypothetical protein